MADSRKGKVKKTFVTSVPVDAILKGRSIQFGPTTRFTTTDPTLQAFLTGYPNVRCVDSAPDVPDPIDPAQFGPCPEAPTIVSGATVATMGKIKRQ